jgi:2-polyprenyl-6-methoxyphenol hydroxylase-like FAD-dependent oxidoreductase
VLARIERFEQLLVNAVARVDGKRWADGRLVLLGDAAHAMAPNLGQGANAAMVDAALRLAARAAGSAERQARRYQQEDPAWLLATTRGLVAKAPPGAGQAAPEP